MLQSIIENLRLGRYGRAMDVANRLQDADLCRLLQDLDGVRSRLLFRRLPPKRQRSLFFAMTLPQRKQLLGALEPSEAAHLALPLPTHEQVRLLEQCPQTHCQALLRKLHSHKRHALRLALDAPADSVMRWMRGQPPLITAGAPAEAARRRLSAAGNRNGLMVVNGDGRYLGLVTNASMAAVADGEPVEQGVIDRRWWLREVDGLSRAGRYLRRSGLAALPVVDSQHRVLGLLAAQDLDDLAAATRGRRVGSWFPGRLMLAGLLLRTAD